MLSVSALTQTEIENNGKYIRSAFLKVMKKPFTDDAKKKILIIGDSHAQDFYNGIVENNYLKNYQIRTRYIPTRCQIFLAQNIYRFTKASDRELCEKSDNLSLANKQIKNADIIILAASWREWSATALPETIKQLQLSNKQQLFVIGGKSFGAIHPEEFAHLSKKNQLSLRNKVNQNQEKINQILDEELDPNIFVDVYQIVCQSTETCPVFTNDLELISLDGGHLTQAGARYIGRLLFNKSSLKNL